MPMKMNCFNVASYCMKGHLRANEKQYEGNEFFCTVCYWYLCVFNAFWKRDDQIYCYIFLQK